MKSFFSNKWWNLRTLGAGLFAGFVAEGIMGGLFMSPPVQWLLYHPQWQSALFRQITPTRDLFYSIAGMVVLSMLHAVFFVLVRSALPGRTRCQQGVVWGVVLWAQYWLQQEWFVYHTLLHEPLYLCAVELGILLVGSVAEGVLLAYLLVPKKQA